MALVEAEALAAHLVSIGARSSTAQVAQAAAETASTYVAAYCTRLRVGDPVPPVVERIALALATRLACNPQAIRSLSAEGQSVGLAPVGLTYLESTLLNPYRRRTA